MLIKRFHFVIGFTTYLIACSSNIGYKSPQQISKGISEAKTQKVFVSKYQIKNIEILNNSIKFPIVEAWEEKFWHLELDKSGNEVPHIVDSASHNIVLKFTNEDTLINKNNFDRWIIWDDNFQNATGYINDMIVITYPVALYMDTIPLTIYKKKTSNDLKNNLTALAKFNLVKQ